MHILSILFSKEVDRKCPFSNKLFFSPFLKHIYKTLKILSFTVGEQIGRLLAVCKVSNEVIQKTQHLLVYI